jgi:hypothetical protein
VTGNADIGLPTGWRDGLVAWAQKNDSIRELWLFGSRAKGVANASSDVDIGLVLMPAKGKQPRPLLYRSIAPSGWTSATGGNGLTCEQAQSSSYRKSTDCRIKRGKDAQAISIGSPNPGLELRSLTE